MKEKIIEFFNGIFVYDQPRLKLEPEELVFELESSELVRGSFVVSSRDERRVKGLLHTRVPGLTLLNDSFYARAARIEYTYQPQHLREGESMEGRIWLETSAGEYELPLHVQIKGAEEAEETDEELPVLLAKETELSICRTGCGRSQKHREMRAQTAALAEIQRVLERERRGACTGQEAVKRFRELADRLTAADPESILYPLFDAWVLLREEKRTEAGRILKKYEKTHLLKLKDNSVRAVFLYVNSLFCGEEKVTADAVVQLQRFYQKQPENRTVTAVLLELDRQLADNPRTRYLVLERLFRAGLRNRLFYQEAYRLLKEDMALFSRLDAFSLQIFFWAASRGLLTAKTAETIAQQAVKIRKWSPMAARLLKLCYELYPSKETVGAVCMIFIRGNRMDEEAFGWYEKGVEYDVKITNLYEYFVYALPKEYPKLLPRQVLLYFHYHNTLTGTQKTKIYCNLVRYGVPGEEVYEEHKKLLQEFLLEQLKGRKVNETLAWLYGRCLLPEMLEGEFLEALADILFLQRITCGEKRIRTVEVCHAQLAELVRVPLTGSMAYVPVYTKSAKITLIDEQGGRHQKSVPYEKKRAMIEPGFLQYCIRKLKNHLGLNLYLLDGEGDHVLQESNLPAAWKLLEDHRVKESYQQSLKLELLEYERKQRGLEQPDERLLFTDAEVLKLSRTCQGSYIESLILLKQDETALRLLWKSGCREVDAGLLLQLLQRLMFTERYAGNLLRALVWQVFQQGIYTEEIIAFLAEEGMGDTRELLAVWTAGGKFGMSLPKLGEQILVQALFTEQYVCEAFPVYMALDDRGGESVLGGAYLNYAGWLNFVKGQEVPEAVYDSLEHHLQWGDRLSVPAVLAYLRHLSALLFLTDSQKRLAGRLLKELSIKNRRFAFIQKLYPYMEENGRPSDHVVVEYRCNPGHKVILHYVLEYHGRKTFDYVSERLYPAFEGVFTRAFILFYGERLTWFITETIEDGTEISTECRTLENQAEQTEGEDRYSRLCRMQQALDHRQEHTLVQMMEEYEKLAKVAEERFRVR